MMAETEENLVRAATKSLCRMEIPKALEESIRQHQRDLTALAAALLESGRDEATVRRSVETVFDSYRDELVKSILALQEGVDHG